MKIAVIGDTHFGHGWGDECEEDSFRQAEEAFDIAIRENVDFILLPGDIFDARIPKQEVWARVLALFQKPLLAGKNQTKLIECENGAVSPLVFNGIPVIAIAGTHERRGGRAVNAVQTLAEAGFLICLDKTGVTLEANGEKVYIYGVGGVPEDFAKKTFAELDAKPKKDCMNLFVFHQSLAEFIPQAEEKNILSKLDLPKGFDWYVDGHIHWAEILDNLLITGSSVMTQQRKKEAERKKGMWVIEGGKPRFIELQSQRPFFCEEITFNNVSPDTVVKECRTRLTKILNSGFSQANNGSAQKPMIRLNLAGTLAAGAELNEDEITKGFDALITVNKEIQNEDFKKKIEILRELQAKKLSVEEQGFGIMQKLLEQTDYKGIAPHEIFEDLSEGEIDAVVKKITEKFKVTN